MKRRLLSWIMAGALALTAGTFAGAAAAQDDASLDALVPLPDAELAELRGGWITAGGMSFDFGVVLRTFVEDQLAMETRLTWTPSGPATERWRDPAQGVDLAEAMDDLAEQGMDLSSLAGVDGLVLEGDGGQTVVLHAIGEGAIQNLVLNTASNRDIRQDTQINLAVDDLPGLQREVSFQRLGGEIGREIGALTALR